MLIGCGLKVVNKLIIFSVWYEGKWNVLWIWGMRTVVRVMFECWISLQWRYNERDGVLNHQPPDCLLDRLFARRLKKTSKLRVTGLCEEDSPITGEFPAQRASNTANVSIWWRHHVLPAPHSIYASIHLPHHLFQIAPNIADHFIQVSRQCIYNWTSTEVLAYITVTSKTSAMASQITGFSIVYSILCSGADPWKQQRSTPLAFVRGIHRLPVDSSHKGLVTRKKFPFDDTIVVK